MGVLFVKGVTLFSHYNVYYYYMNNRTRSNVR